MRSNSPGGRWSAAPRSRQGFNVNDRITTVAELKRLMEAFVAEREWTPFHDPKNLSASIAIEAAELMEHFQWVRSDELETVSKNEERLRLIREEVADILAYLLSFATRLGIDLSSALEEKMCKNAMKYPADRYRGRYRLEE